MSKNYRINTKGKKNTVSIYGTLEDNEKMIVEMYLNNGYELVPSKRKPKKDTNKKSVNRLKKAEILEWFDSKKDEKGKKLFEAELKGEGKGFFKACAWLRENYPEAQAEIEANRK